jgi:dTDP-4-dehydrorhamnose 3,5-epimerase-like enzyme
MQLRGATTDRAETIDLLGGKARIIPVSGRSDERGSLIPFEFSAMPFVPRRAFVVRDVPAGALRGGHAHGEQQLLLVCLAGRVAVRLVLGQSEDTAILCGPHQALFIDAGIWSEQRYLDPETCLFVFASGPYDPADYVDATE